MPVILVLALLAGRAQPPNAPLAALDQSMAAAERALQAGDFAAAERSCRVALVEGWTILSLLADSSHDVEGARRARQHAEAEREVASPLATAQNDLSAIASLSVPDRTALETRVRPEVARAAFNLGVLEAQRSSHH